MPGDHPDIPFLQARQLNGDPAYTTGRPDGPPLWIVIHTMEEDELPTTAEAVARYFHNGAGGRSVSSHYCFDADSEVQCVLLKDVAWTVGNRPGNYRGINYELAGRAAQTAAQWADAYSQSMLRRVARIAARDMARFSIPARWCTVDDLKARRPGLTTHNDLRLAFGVTSHTDPGAHFPRAQFLEMVKQGDDFMATIDQVDWDALIWRVEALVSARDTIAGGPQKGQAVPFVAAVKALAGDQVDEAAIVAGVLAGLSPQAIADLVVAALPPELARGLADELAARLQG